MGKPEQRRTVGRDQATARTRSGRQNKEGGPGEGRTTTRNEKTTSDLRPKDTGGGKDTDQKEQDNNGRAEYEAGQLMTQAAVILTGDGNNGKKRKGDQAKDEKGGQQPDNTKTARKEPTKDSPLTQANRHNKQESAKDEACRNAVRNTTAIVMELQKDRMQQTVDNKEWIQWAARTEGDNARRGTSETTDHCIAHITWLCNKDKRAQRGNYRDNCARR
jgi:hypothetical protein